MPSYGRSVLSGIISEGAGKGNRDTDSRSGLKNAPLGGAEKGFNPLLKDYRPTRRPLWIPAAVSDFRLIFPSCHVTAESLVIMDFYVEKGVVHG